MADPVPQRPNILPGYGISSSDEGLMAWEWVRERMTQSRNYWIATTSADGAPHVAPVWGVWIGDALYFGTDGESRKGRNIARDPRAVVHLESGDEVAIIEGVVELATDVAALVEYADAYEKKYELRPDASPGGAYVLRPQKALAWREKDFPKSATVFRFS